jgi:hypothetical protein
VAIDTLLGSDPNTENGWGETGYNPIYLTADGYVALIEPQSFALIGAALAAVLPGSTFVIQWMMLGSDVTAYVAVLSASGNAAVEYDIQAFSNSLAASSWNGSYAATIPDVVRNTAGFTNKMAVTLTPTRSEVSVNGSAATASALTTDDYPTSGEDQLVAFIVQGHEALYAIQSITIYDPLPDTTGLSDLSSTGTNTAPHDLDVHAWNEPTVAGGSISQADTVGTIPAIPGEYCHIADFSVTDDEGDPVHWDFISDETTRLIIVEPQLGGMFGVGMLKVGLPAVATGDYNFTLRATDLPGYLYVEQEFTITVTA